VIDGVGTLNPGESATLSVFFDGTNVRFTFGLPRGADGLTGTEGAQGPAGPSIRIMATSRRERKRPTGDWQGMANGLAKLLKGELDPNALAHAVAKAEHSGVKEMTEAEFAALLPASPKTQPLKSGAVISRAAAMSLMLGVACAP
jgi:hypothetical protein